MLMTSSSRSSKKLVRALEIVTLGQIWLLPVNLGGASVGSDSRDAVTVRVDEEDFDAHFCWLLIDCAWNLNKNKSDEDSEVFARCICPRDGKQAELAQISNPLDLRKRNPQRSRNPDFRASKTRSNIKILLCMSMAML
jgi:hypothetical protein